VRHDPVLMLLSCTLALALAFLGLAGTSGAQEEEDHRPASAMSRQMKLGIHFYEKGEDIQAMDRFLDVLSKGDPSERALANEYINLITQRMNSGAKVPRHPPSLRPREAFEEATVPGRAPPPEEIAPEFPEEGKAALIRQAIVDNRRGDLPIGGDRQSFCRGFCGRHDKAGVHEDLGENPTHVFLVVDDKDHGRYFLPRSVFGSIRRNLANSVWVKASCFCTAVRSCLSASAAAWCFIFFKSIGSAMLQR